MMNSLNQTDFGGDFLLVCFFFSHHFLKAVWQIRIRRKMSEGFQKFCILKFSFFMEFPRSVPGPAHGAGHGKSHEKSGKLKLV